MDKKKKRQQRLDRIGIACGILLVVLAIFSIVSGNKAPVAGVKDSEIPESAVTLTGTADGRNGPVTVEVVADAEKIYRIAVTDHQETEGIGSEAVKNLPAAMFQAQNVAEVDAVSGATISSAAIQEAMTNAFTSLDAKEAAINPKTFGANPIKVELAAQKPDVEALKQEGGGHIMVLTSADWAEIYPNQYRTWKQNEENTGMDENGVLEDYLVEYPMLSTLYDTYGFSWDYKGARGHMFDIEDVTSTERVGGKTMSSCFTCKTPNMTAMALEEGDAAYGKPFAEVKDMMVEPISCFNCHANNPLNDQNEVNLVMTHTYLIDGVGEDFDSIDAANLSCGQCHNEYYFESRKEGKPTTLPHDSLESMHPDAILAYYNQPLWDGQGFADFTTSSGVREIKVQHPEMETFLSEGSPHRNKYSCADCHMGQTRDENGKTFSSHYLISPLDNPELIEAECSKCHTDLVKEVREVQAQVENPTYSIGYELMFLHQRLIEVQDTGEYTDEELTAIRALARDAQFYWDFVFVENAEGAHNPKLTNYCLDQAEDLCNQAMAMFHQIVKTKP